MPLANSSFKAVRQELSIEFSSQFELSLSSLTPLLVLLILLTGKEVDENETEGDNGGIGVVEGVLENVNTSGSKGTGLLEGEERLFVVSADVDEGDGEEGGENEKAGEGVKTNGCDTAGVGYGDDGDDDDDVSDGVANGGAENDGSVAVVVLWLMLLFF